MASEPPPTVTEATPGDGGRDAQLSPLAAETAKPGAAQQGSAEPGRGPAPATGASALRPLTQPALRGRRGAPPPARDGNAAASSREGTNWQVKLVDRAPFLVACVMLVVLVAIYASLREGVFTLEELNLDAAASMALLLAATGQTIVLLRGGIDLSIGGMVSLGTVIAATELGDSWMTATAWSLAILAIGLLVGMANGLIISVLRLQPFLVTLATWSILSGAALLILPTDGGSLPAGWMAFGTASFLGLSSSVWVLIVLFLFWLWFRNTRLGVTIRATGSNEKSAYLSGVSLTFVNVATYGLSGLFAALAALYLTTQTGAGSPTIGKDYILPSVAAAVIGGISLFGGRGGLAGTIIGAFILTIIGNLVFVLSVSSYWQPIVSGVILLVAVLASSLAERSARRSVA